MRPYRLLTLSVVLAAAPMMAATPLIHEDSTRSARVWQSKSNAGTERMTLVWHPERPSTDTLYIIFGECGRTADGVPRGKHKVIFKNLEVFGVDSELAASGTTQNETVRNGVQDDFVAWDLTPLGPDLAGDSAVLVSVDVQVKKKVSAFDELFCELSVLELLDPDSLASRDSAARLDHVRQLDLGRGFGQALGRIQRDDAAASGGF